MIGTCHERVNLYTELTFREHLYNKINKCNRITGSIGKLTLILPRKCLLIIYKASVRPHLDYARIIYDKPKNESFKDLLEKIQHNAALTMIDAIRGTSREFFYNEIALQ